MRDEHRCNERARGGAYRRRATERLLVLTLLSREERERWPRAELQRELSEISAEQFDSALERLSRDGLACVQADAAWAARPTRALDELDLICV